MYIESVRVIILWCPSCHLQSLFLFATLCSLLPRIFVFPHFDVESTLTSYLAGLSGPALSQYPLSRPTFCPPVLCLLLSTHIAGHVTCSEVLSSTCMCMNPWPGYVAARSAWMLATGCVGVFSFSPLELTAGGCVITDQCSLRMELVWLFKSFFQFHQGSLQ